MRSLTRSRYYVQCGLDEKLKKWSDTRFWDELRSRLSPQVASAVITGPVYRKKHRSVAQFRGRTTAISDTNLPKGGRMTTKAIARWTTRSFRFAGSGTACIDFRLRRDRGIAAAQAFFRKALGSNGSRFPRTVTLVEQGRRGIKARCGPLKGFKSFVTAAVTLDGFEYAHRIRKRQFNCKRRRHRFGRNRRIDWEIALA